MVPMAARRMYAFCAQARGESATPERATRVQCRLEGLIKRLDSLLPYLGVAISSVNLLDTGMHACRVAARSGVSCARS